MVKGEYRLGFRADIEGLRAIAIMLVVAAHAGVPWLQGGFVGVDVFFVLSGFLITGLLLREVADSGSIRFVEFYLRRLRRLLPAMAFMIIATCLVAANVLSPAEQLEQAKAGATASLWASNIYFALVQLDYFSAGAEGNLFLHTWSLGVEEQFYLVWPILLLWTLGRNRGLARLGQLKALMFVVMMLSLVMAIYLTYSLPQLAFYMMPMRAWQFAVGALVCLVGRSGAMFRALPSGVSHERLSNWLGWLGLATIVAAGIVWSSRVPYPSWRALFPALGTAAIIAAGQRGALAGVSRFLAWRPLQLVGRVSYSWYLWHWPVLLLGYAIIGSHSPWLRAALVFISLGLALVSYGLIEAPIRHQSFLLKHARLALPGAVVAMVAIGFFAMHWYTRAFVETNSQEFQRYSQAHGDAPVIYGMGCDEWYHSDRVAMCSFGPADAPHTAVLMGDSVAGQWFPAFAEVFDRPDWRVLVLTKSACPMVDEPIFYERIGRDYTECTNWRRHALEQLASIKPDVVMLGTVSTNGFTKEQWIDGTKRVLSTLSPVAGRIYIMRGTPHLPFDGPNCLSSHQVRPAWLNALAECSAPANDEHAQSIFGWLGEATASVANARTVDMNDVVCPGQRCRAELDGHVVFRDSQHLTASFAESMAPLLKSRMESPGKAGAPAVNALIAPQ